MDLKVVFVIVCLCALAITSTEAGIPKCCLSTKRTIPKRVMYKVYRMVEQQGNGACDIPALILYIKGKRYPICADPKLKKIVEAIQEKQNKQ